jgi:hypothetical protein
MMKGKEEIEWQDRSWRILGNKGLLEYDDWYALFVVGTAVGYGDGGLAQRRREL